MDALQSKSVGMKRKNRPVLIIGFLGVLVSLLFVPFIFGRFLALTELTHEEIIALWLFAGILCFVSVCIAANRLRWSEQLALALFSLLLLISGELLFRFVVVGFSPVWRDQVIKHGLVAYPDQWRFRPHPFLQYVGNHKGASYPGMYNLIGFPGEEHDRKKSANVIRIVCLGGSTTEDPRRLSGVTLLCS